MANIFEDVYNWLKEKGKGTLSQGSDNGPYTSSAGSSGGTKNTSTYSNVPKQQSKAYDQPYTSSQKNYTQTQAPKASVSSAPAQNNAYTSSYSQPTYTPYQPVSIAPMLSSVNDKARNVLDFARTAFSAYNKSRVNNGMEAPLTGVAQLTAPLVQKTSEAIGSIYQNAKQQSLDEKFAKLASQEDVLQKIRSDIDYKNKIMDDSGNLIDYTNQISLLKQQMADPVTRSDEINRQLNELEEIQKDQNKLLYASYYKQLIDKGATQEELNQFKNYVIAEDMNGIERTLGTVGGSFENFVGSMAKGYESMYAAASNLLGVDYDANDPGSIGNVVINNADQLLANARQGAGGVEAAIQEIFTSEANYLYSVALSMLTNKASFSSMAADEALKEAVSAKALLYSDISVFGSSVKQKMDEGYDFWTSFDYASLSAAMSDLTERIGGETFFDLFSRRSGQELAKNYLNYTARHLAKSFGSEMLEEGVEGFASPVIEALALEKRNLTLKEYINRLDLEDVGHQMLIGGLGGLVGGVTGVAGLTISTNKDVNQMKAIRNSYQELIETDAFTPEEKAFIQSNYITEINTMINQYRAANPFADAFFKESDLDVVETSVESNDEAFRHFEQVDLAQKLEPIAALKEQMLQRTDEFYETGRERLASENIDMDVFDYETLSTDAKINTSITSKFAKSLGRNVTFANLVDANGDIVDGVYMNGRTVINPNAKQGALSTLLHEYTHGMESSRYYGALKKAVEEYMGDDFSSAIEKIRNDYSTIVKLDTKGAEKELVAIASQGLLENMQFVERLVKYNNSLATRVYEDIRHLAGYTDSVSDIEYNFMRAFKDASNNAMDHETDDAQPQYAKFVRKLKHEGVKVEMRMSWNESVDAVLKGTYSPTSDHVMVLQTTPYYMERYADMYGELPLLIEISHIKSAVNTGSRNNLHTIGIDKLRRLPELIQDPLVMYEHRTKKGKYESINIILKEPADDGQPIVVAIKPTKEGTYLNIKIDSNMISSIIDKDDIERLADEAYNHMLFPGKSIMTKEKLLSTMNENHTLANPNSSFPTNSISNDNTNDNTQKSIGINLEDIKNSMSSDIAKDARKQLKEISDPSRRVQMRDVLDATVNDILSTGDISMETYDQLRRKVVESTLEKIPNGEYDTARDIRSIMGAPVLPKNHWDVTLKEINDKYNIFDDGDLPTNYQDAKESIRNYLDSIGGKYLYVSPVEQGWMSRNDYDEMIDSKLETVISDLKRNVNQETNLDDLTMRVADILTDEQMQQLDNLTVNDILGNTEYVNNELNRLKSEEANRATEEALYALQNDSYNIEDQNKVMQDLAEKAAQGSMEPEQLDELEDQMLKKYTIDEAKQKTTVLKDIKKNEPLRKNKDLFYQIRQKIFDKGIAIRDMKNRKLSAQYDYLLNAENMANFAILEGMYDRSGKKLSDSLEKISSLIPESDKNDFDYYMYHRHNIDAAKVGKNVFFGFEAKQSEQIVNQYEMLHPDWKDVAQKYYDLNDLLLQKQVDSGMISEDMAKLWKEMYPHYVPTKRVTDAVDEGNVVETAEPDIVSSNKGTLYERTGGTSPIQPLDYAMAEHMKQIYKSVLFNQFAKEYIDAAKAKTTMFNEQMSPEDIIQGGEDLVTEADEYTPATMIYYDHGDRHIVELPQKIYDAVETTVRTPFNLPSSIPFVSWATKLRTNMITGANPVFWLTNGFKDFQDIAFNSKYAKDTYFNLPKAYMQLLTNGDIANLYKSQGGEYLTYSSEAGLDQNKHGKFYNATIGNFVKFNNLVEMAPRLAEFMSSLDHGDSIETAMYNAAEVTTNFKRGGDYAKWLNRNGANFFNASIQGFDKQIRNIEDAYDSKGWKGILGYMAKSTLLSGIPLIVLNGLLHKGDDDYEDLSDYIKDNYYVLWKYDDGKYFRIPKGRIANAYQGIMTSLYENGVELASDDAAAKKAKIVWENTLDSLKNVWDQIGINDLGNNNLLSPVIQVINNEAWYGDPIVSDYMKTKDNPDQYDESTDLLSIWLGEKLNFSPKKINYLIDQYSGGAGDVILPMLTQKAETGFDDGTVKGKVTSAVLSPFADKFITDSVFKNQNVTDFFALDEELTELAKKEHASDETKLASMYINSIQKSMNDYYAKRREIYKNDSLTDSQKYEQAREVQRQIDDLAEYALNTYDQLDVAAYYGDVNGQSYYKTTTGDWSRLDPVKDAELKSLGLSTSEKSDYFYTSNTISQIRKDIKDDTPYGKKAEYKEATIDAIQTSNLNAKAKNYLYDTYYSGKFTDNVNSMDISDEDKLAIKIANSKGVSMKDSKGKTISNSKALSTADAYADAGVLDDVFAYIKKNGIQPSEMGLTKTVYNYSYNQMAAAYQRIFGQSFGSGDTSDVDLSAINTSYYGTTRKSSGKTSRKKSSGGSRGGSSRSELARQKKLRKALMTFLKNANKTRSSDISSIMKNMTTIKDAEANVKKIMQNAYKG